MGRLLWDGGLDSPFVCRGGARGGVIMGGGDYYGMGVWVNPLLPMGGGCHEDGAIIMGCGSGFTLCLQGGHRGGAIMGGGDYYGMWVWIHPVLALRKRRWSIAWPK